jgi:hypothetical protein
MEWELIELSHFSRATNSNSSAKNCSIFLERCLHHKIVPTFLRNSCPIKSKRAQRLTFRYQLSVLKETLYLARGQRHQISLKAKTLFETLKSTLLTEYMELITKISSASYYKDYEKRKTKLKKKFEKLLNEIKPLLHITQPSTIKNSVLQLQKEPLPPEAIDILSLGHFTLTPKEVPYMEIIQEIEKGAISHTRRVKQAEAEEIQHRAANILLNSHPPKSNLTATQKKDLSYLKKNEKLSVSPFDKGQGFCTIEREKLVQKAEKKNSKMSPLTPPTPRIRMR